MKTRSILSYLLSMAVLFYITACSSGGDGGDGSSEFSSQTITMAADASSQLVTLEKMTTFIASAAASDSWLTVEVMPYTSGTPTVKLTATANTNTTERRTKVIVFSINEERVELTVTQKARTVSPSDDSNVEVTHEVVTDQPAYAPQRE